MIVSEVVDTIVGDAHVTCEQIADINQGTYGEGDYVLPFGRRLEAQLITSNKVRIFDGGMVYCGVRDVIAVNNYHDVTIENGSQSMKRNDIIVRRFTKDEVTHYGQAEFVAVKGTATDGTPEDPEIEVTDLRKGALVHDMPLYRVKLEGLNIIAVEPLYNVLISMVELQEILAGKQDTITGGASTIATKNLAAKRALISNSAGKVAVASTTVTELEYLHGVKSNVQNQLDNKNILKCRTSTHMVAFEWTGDNKLLIIVDNSVVATFKNGTNV